MGAALYHILLYVDSSVFGLILKFRRPLSMSPVLDRSIFYRATVRHRVSI